MGQATPIRQTKRLVLTELARRVGPISVCGQPMVARRNADALRFEAPLPEDGRALIAISTIKRSLPVGQFALWPNILLYGGSVRKILDQLPLPSRQLDRLGAVLCADGTFAAGGGQSYRVTSPTSRNVGVLAGHIRRSFVPLLEAFSGNWEHALTVTLNHPNFVARPFSTSVILALLAHHDDKIGQICDTAAADPRFWDAHVYPNPTPLITKIHTLLPQPPSPGPAPR